MSDRSGTTRRTVEPRSDDGSGPLDAPGRVGPDGLSLKLQGIYDGTLYATSYRTVYSEGAPGRFRRLGRLPVQGSGLGGLQYRLMTTRPWKTVAESIVGRFPTVNVWQTSDDTFVGSAVRYLFVSTDGGHTWRVTERLPDSSGPMGVLPTAFCVHEGHCYVGEYPLASDAAPRVLRSDDRGETWTTELTLPSVRHVHAIEPDPYTGDLWMTTGDAGAECRIGRLRNGEFEAVGSGSQHWRAVQPVFTPNSVLWGVDSVYTDSNPIYLLDRGQLGEPEPDVRQVGSVDSSVYYGTTVRADDCWVVFSTAREPGVDSTAPDDQRVVRSGPATVVAASGASGYERWHELATYEKRVTVGDASSLRGTVPVANAYVYLASDADRGLFVNPYNTDRHDGTVRQYPLAFFDELA